MKAKIGLITLIALVSICVFSCSVTLNPTTIHVYIDGQYDIIHNATVIYDENSKTVLLPNTGFEQMQVTEIGIFISGTCIPGSIVGSGGGIIVFYGQNNNLVAAIFSGSRAN